MGVAASFYKQAGVDLKAYASLLQSFAKILPQNDSFFCALLPFQKGFLAASCDSVGTKILLANRPEHYRALGIDAVAMVANDIVPSGAAPLFLLDYLAMAKLDAQRIQSLLDGLQRGCQSANMKLIGGETAEMPGVYPRGGYDLAAFGVGWTSSHLQFLRRQKAGDKLYALPSSGFHANGFSLVRYVLKKKRWGLDRPFSKRKSLRDILLTPTTIYVKQILHFYKKNLIRGCAHITGGGIPENLPRTIKKGLQAVVRKSWRVPPLFHKFVMDGGVPEEEAFRVWNMGVGMVVVVDSKKAMLFQKEAAKIKQKIFPIGILEKGTEGVVFA